MELLKLLFQDGQDGNSKSSSKQKACSYLQCGSIPVTAAEIALTWTNLIAEEPDMPLVYSRPCGEINGEGCLKKSSGTTWPRYLLQWVSLSKFRRSPSGVFLERYWWFEINEVERWRRMGRCWLAQGMSCLWTAVLWPSSCVGCAASPTCLTSRQTICKWCFLVAVEYRHSGCGLKGEKQHRARLLAILKTKSVIWSNSKVLNIQISAGEDKLVIYEEMRQFGKK